MRSAVQGVKVISASQHCPGPEYRILHAATMERSRLPGQCWSRAKPAARRPTPYGILSTTRSAWPRGSPAAELPARHRSRVLWPPAARRTRAQFRGGRLDAAGWRGSSRYPPRHRAGTPVPPPPAADRRDLPAVTDPPRAAARLVALCGGDPHRLRAARRGRATSWATSSQCPTHHPTTSYLRSRRGVRRRARARAP